MARKSLGALAKIVSGVLVSAAVAGTGTKWLSADVTQAAALAVAAIAVAWAFNGDGFWRTLRVVVPSALMGLGMVNPEVAQAPKVVASQAIAPAIAWVATKAEGFAGWVKESSTEAPYREEEEAVNTTPALPQSETITGAAGILDQFK